MIDHMVDAGEYVVFIDRAHDMLENMWYQYINCVIHVGERERSSDYVFYVGEHRVSMD